MSLSWTIGFNSGKGLEKQCHMLAPEYDTKHGTDREARQEDSALRYGAVFQRSLDRIEGRISFT
jgi:hypothetical protein